jgi:hypothetical protein
MARAVESVSDGRTLYGDWQTLTYTYGAASSSESSPQSYVSAEDDIVNVQMDPSAPTVALHVFDNDSATHQSQRHFVRLTQPSVGTVVFQSDDPMTAMSGTWSQSDPTAPTSTPLPVLVYTPPAGFEGQQTFQYTLADDGGAMHLVGHSHRPGGACGKRWQFDGE